MSKYKKACVLYQIKIFLFIWVTHRERAKMVNIVISIDSEAPPEPSGPADLLTLVYISNVTLIMLAVCLFMSWRRRYSISLRFKTGSECYVFFLCALIDSFGTFIANQQLSSLNHIRFIDCALWSYWFQYMPKAIYFCTIMHRILQTGFRFNRFIKNLSTQRKTRIKNISFLVIMVPITVMCMIISIGGKKKK
jgi:hypothetical protein